MIEPIQVTAFKTEDGQLFASRTEVEKHQLDHLYWAITGRLCGDDEDTPHTYGPCSRSVAHDGFCADLHEEAGLPEILDSGVGPDGDAIDGVTVLITSVFQSATPIEIQS